MDDSGTTQRRRPLIPGVSSYRGRYLYLALLIMAAFSIAGVFGYFQVSSVSEQNLRNIQDRAQATALLHDGLGHLQELQAKLGRYLINPPQEMPTSLLSTGQQLAATLAQLHDSPWIHNDEEMLLLTESADTDLRRLTTLLAQLVHLRAERSRWLPATSSIENGINPATIQGQAILSEMADEANQAPLSRENAQLRRMLSEMQLRWQQAVAEVRLLITNRFGVFASDTRSGMMSRAKNTRLFLGEFRKHLAHLERLQAAGKLGFIASNRLGELKASGHQFELAVADTLTALTRDDWRPDVSLVRDRIEPVVDTLQQRMSSLRLELDIQSARNITELTAMSRHLTEFVALLIGAGALFAALAYTMFDRMLLRPIQQTTLALKQEAMGNHANLPPQAKAAETRDLVEAFEEMRQQVRRRQDHLDHLAHHDVLTGLPNRLLFRDRLDHAVALAHRNNSILAVLFLDLDRFKQINDSLGHATGDALLKQAAQRLQSAMRESDTVARLGGDEFAILAEGIKRREEITRLAEKVIDCLEEPFDVEGRTLHISTSIGITFCPMDDHSPDGLLQGADAAMYEAKRAGKGQFRYFTAEMTEQATEYLNLETHLRAAVIAEQFELHFQPITDETGTRLHACEALLRWHHPEEHRNVSPCVFIPVLDDMGQMGKVSQWILEAIHRQQQVLRAAGHGDVTISINLTARLLHDERFSQHLLEALSNCQPNPKQLVVEITEDSLTQDLEAAGRVLYALKELGVRIALDDFGTGQSSLNHLRRYPFDLVKIDREFVRDIPHDPNDVSLVRAVIELSHAFGMKVVAEGVETAEQQLMLLEMGCDYLQGFRISRPITAAALDAFLANQRVKPVLADSYPA
jgi:diguanylate cyclase (GGDEF)-like protein